jgi:hypothetical protein
VDPGDALAWSPPSVRHKRAALDSGRVLPEYFTRGCGASAPSGGFHLGADRDPREVPRIGRSSERQADRAAAISRPGSGPRS